MRRVLVACACALLLLSSPAQAEAPATQGNYSNISIIPREESATRSPTTPTPVQVQYALRSFGYSLAVDGVNGPVTQRAVRHFQKANGLVVDGIAGEQTWAAIQAAATADAPAVRIDPPAPPPVLTGLNGMPFAPPGLSQQDKEAFYRAQAGMPPMMDDISYREARWQNTLTSSAGCCVGAWQIHTGNFTAPGYAPGIAACGVRVRSDIMGEDGLAWQKQACVANVLYQWWVDHPGTRWPWAL